VTRAADNPKDNPTAVTMLTTTFATFMTRPSLSTRRAQRRGRIDCYMANASSRYRRRT
jgi:hypothetical protein